MILLKKTGTSQNTDEANASFTVPANTPIGKTMHNILEVTDSKKLIQTRYQRAIAKII